MNTIEPLKFLEADEVASLATQYGTPLFVYDLPGIKKNYDSFSEMPNPYGLTVRYSVKANPTRSILNYFDHLGACFDVSSTWEARRCINAGIDPKKILMTAQEVSDGWEDLCSTGMEFDAGSLHQIKMYGEKFPNTRISLRINPGFGSGLVKKLTSGGAHSSFGLWFQQIEEAKSLAKKYALTIKRIHLHIGSGHEPETLKKAIVRALALCNGIPSVTHLNFGGGYKVTALNSDARHDHHATGKHISESIEKFYRDTGRKLHLELEPGTFSIALAGSLITRVIDVVTTGENGFRFIKIDSGLTEIMRPSYYGAVHPLVVVKQNNTTGTPDDICAQMVCGHCCIAGDILTPRPGDSENFSPMMLARAEVGDYLVVERAGGYAASMSVKNFNSYPEAAEVCRVAKNEYHLARARQTLEQMTQNERDLNITDTEIPNLLKGNIEGSTDVYLAPIQGADMRRNLGHEYFIKKPGLFVTKFVFACLLVGLGWYAVWYGLNKPPDVVPVLVIAGGMLLNGLIYAHLLELQHECLHFHAFDSPRLNRIFGVLTGVFMFSSYTHYRHDHLHHHAYLGTERNNEHFDYRFSNLNSLKGFATAFFDLDRYRRVTHIIRAIFSGGQIPGVVKKEIQKRIKLEYSLCTTLFIASIAASIYLNTLLFALAWWIPLIIISEGVHFLIEMPEHYGLNTQSLPNIFDNTRTIHTNATVA